MHFPCASISRTRGRAPDCCTLYFAGTLCLGLSGAVLLLAKAFLRPKHRALFGPLLCRRRSCCCLAMGFVFCQTHAPPPPWTEVELSCVPQGEVFGSKFNPDGNLIASAGFDRQLCGSSQIIFYAVHRSARLVMPSHRSPPRFLISVWCVAPSCVLPCITNRDVNIV